jgi:hypothetical protein
MMHKSMKKVCNGKEWGDSTDQGTIVGGKKGRTARLKLVSAF